jgi:hypothetical protein
MADSTVAGLTLSGALTGTELFYADNGVTDVRVPANVLRTFIGIETLTAQRDYFVRTDGSDSNTGLANTSGAAFLTIQHAVEVALSLNFNGNNVYIHVEDGTYDTSGGLLGVRIFGPYISTRSGGFLTIVGNISNPQNVIINSGAYNGFYVSNCYVEVYGFTLGSTTRDGLAVVTAGGLGYGYIRFNNCRYCIRADYASYCYMYAPCTTIGVDIISPAKDAYTGGFCFSKNGSVLELFDTSVTISSGATFANFAQAQFGRIDTHGMTFVNPGNVVGSKYFVSENGAINTNSLPTDVNYFPGTVAGTVGSGDNWGVYI